MGALKRYATAWGIHRNYFLLFLLIRKRYRFESYHPSARVCGLVDKWSKSPPFHGGVAGSSPAEVTSFTFVRERVKITIC